MYDWTSLVTETLITCVKYIYAYKYQYWLLHFQKGKNCPWFLMYDDLYNTHFEVLVQSKSLFYRLWSFDTIAFSSLGIRVFHPIPIFSLVIDISLQAIYAYKFCSLFGLHSVPLMKKPDKIRLSTTPPPSKGFSILLDFIPMVGAEDEKGIW